MGFLVNGGNSGGGGGGGGGFVNPMTTLGDVIYGASSGVATRLAGSVSTSKYYLASIGNGTNALAPSLRDFNADVNTAITQQTVGVIINEAWTNLSAWTVVGSGFSVSAGLLTANGGTPASPSFGNYIKNTGYGNSVYSLINQQADITVGTINSTSWGISFGVQGVGGFTPVTIHGALMLDSTNKGKLRFYNSNSNSVSGESTGTLGISTGDIVTLKMSFNYGSVTLSAYNKTTKRGITFTGYPLEMPLNLIANTYQHTIYAIGGTDHNVSNYTVNVYDKKNVDYLFVGDSFVGTFNGVNPNNYFVRLLQEKITDILGVYAGPGNRIIDAVPSEILALAPKNIIIQLGVNDGATQTAATVVSRLNTLIASLTGYTLGVNLFISEITPNGNFDASGYAALYAITYSTGIIPTFHSMKAVSGTGGNPAYFLPDLLHPNGYGNEVMSNIYYNSIPFNKKTFAKFQSGGTSASYVYPIRFVDTGVTGMPVKQPLTLEAYNGDLYFTNGSLVTTKLNNPSSGISGLTATRILFSASSTTIADDSGMEYTFDLYNASIWINRLGARNNSNLIVGSSFNGGCSLQFSTAGNVNNAILSNCLGSYGGTSGTAGGRHLSFIDVLGFGSGAVLMGGFGPTGIFYIGASNTVYGFKSTQAGVVNITNSLFVGGSATPTALAHLGASTTSKAPLRLTVGVAPTAPNDGDIWYDGTSIYLRVGGTTKTFTIV